MPKDQTIVKETRRDDKGRKTEVTVKHYDKRGKKIAERQKKYYRDK